MRTRALAALTHVSRGTVTLWRPTPEEDWVQIISSAEGIGKLRQVWSSNPAAISPLTFPSPTSGLDQACSREVSTELPTGGKKKPPEMKIDINIPKHVESFFFPKIMLQATQMPC